MTRTMNPKQGYRHVVLAAFGLVAVAGVLPVACATAEQSDWQDPGQPPATDSGSEAKADISNQDVKKDGTGGTAGTDASAGSGGTAGTGGTGGADDAGDSGGTGATGGSGATGGNGATGGTSDAGGSGGTPAWFGGEPAPEPRCDPGQVFLFGTCFP
jgi:hypothetical protein